MSSSQATASDERRDALKPYLAAGVAVLIWGASPAATRVAVLEMDPLAAGMLRTVLAALLIWPFLLRPTAPRPRGRGQWAVLAVTAASGFVGFTLLFALGVKATSAAHSAVINATIPLFSGFFGVLAVRRLPGAMWFVGMAVAFGGVVSLIALKTEGGAGATLSGDLMCLASSVCAGLGYVSGSRLTTHIGTLAVTFWGVLVAALVQAPLVFFLWDVGDWTAISFNGWAAALYLALGSSLLAYIAWYWGLANGGVVRIAPMQFLMPVVSLSLAVVAFGEALTWQLCLATLGIVGGIALSRKG
ncbi:DMT family transporter [Magnetovibrio sp.]|uniref:DMT family transporter n=1 Tax=Magnetovibrio sp. TaxID=2024836 RepID=UPI002F92FD02